MIEVDARGRSCPEPVVMAKKALDQYDGQEITVQVDTNVAKENVSRLATNSGFSVKLEENGKEVKIFCSK
jgi:TusA-related sulfurtransferase